MGWGWQRKAQRSRPPLWPPALFQPPNCPPLHCMRAVRVSLTGHNIRHRCKLGQAPGQDGPGAAVLLCCPNPPAATARPPAMAAAPSARLRGPLPLCERLRQG